VDRKNLFCIIFFIHNWLVDNKFIIRIGGKKMHKILEKIYPRTKKDVIRLVSVLLYIVSLIAAIIVAILCYHGKVKFTWVLCSISFSFFWWTILNLLNNIINKWRSKLFLITFLISLIFTLVMLFILILHLMGIRPVLSI
jgi:hypothetical protein